MLPPITLVDRIEHGYLWLHRQADYQAISEQNGESSKDFGESEREKMKHHRKKRGKETLGTYEGIHVRTSKLVGFIELLSLPLEPSRAKLKPRLGSQVPRPIVYVKE